MTLNITWEILNALKVLVNNSFKESHYGEKKYLMFFIGFFIFHKSDIKTFLKWIANQFLKTLISMTILLL